LVRVQKIPTLKQTYTGYVAKLMLEDGTVFDGIGFGYPSGIAGEVVFNTGMVGYTETLTDPSYRGQILCLTYPLVGNYGVPSYNIKDEYGLPKFFESDRIQVKGLLIHDLSDIASHWSCIKTLDQWLYEEKVQGIYNIDTRELTKKLREHGVMMGAIVVSENAIDESLLKKMLANAKYEGLNFMPEVSIKEAQQYGDKGKDCIVVLDTGVKYSIIRNIMRTGYRVVRLPWHATYEQTMSYNPKGVVISNTVEGFEHKSKPIIAVQFHPEASPGPYDCMFVFDRFREIIVNGMKDKTGPAEGASLQHVKKTIKPLKKFVTNKKIGGRKIAKK
jgi:carbamoyl-phosphate synthase small subunit